MKRIVLVFLASLSLAAKAAPLEWVFPLSDSCHQGLAFADGVTGVLVWGGGDTVRLTVGRADLWDHRGGYPWTAEQSYTNIVAAVRSGDKGRLLSLFRKETPPGQPRNPYMLPLGRVTVSVPHAELKFGSLDPKTGLGTLTFAKGGERLTVELAMSKESRQFSMRFPEGLQFSAEATPALATPIAGQILRKVGFVEPERFAYAGFGGFVQAIPADPPVSLEWHKSGSELALRTFRNEKKPSAKPVAKYESVAAESRNHWAAFWAESARVEVPDPVIQRVYDYGMYRFGAMTDPDGVPAGLQGPWLEDDRLVPWNGDYHFNINVQECYSPAYRGGHLKHLLPLFRMVSRWLPRLNDNAKKFCGIDNGYVLPHSVDDRGVCIGGFWTGTIDHASTAWVASMMFRYVKYSRDMRFLRESAYPFMKGAMNVYRAMMEEKDGSLSLPLGPSPEWGGDDVRYSVGRNPSFQLAAAHRLARDLTEAASMLGASPDPMWLQVDRRLPDYTADRDGLMLFEGQSFVTSHRHHSHLAGLYPFDTLNLADTPTKRVVSASYRTWVRRGTGAWTGWCVPWASILHTHIGNSVAAVEMLRAWDAFFCNDGHGSHHNAYRQGFSDMMMTSSGPRGETIDGGYVMQMDGQSAVTTAVLELMVHEVNGKQEFFKGCPPSWRRVRFENVLTSEGKRVSGLREDGLIRIW